jgi:leader peptidase (prepilin peptidase)/N-methyltransferase
MLMQPRPRPHILPRSRNRIVSQKRIDYPCKRTASLDCFRLSPLCRRRRAALCATARDIVMASGEGRPLAPTAWTALLTLALLPTQAMDAYPFSSPALALSTVALFFGLCLIGLFDARYFIIPDGPLLFLAFSGTAATLATAPREAASRLAAGAAGFVLLRLVGLAYEKLRATPGLGGGDASLFAVAGLWLGMEGLPSCLIYAALSALVSAAIAMRQGALDSARQPIPFGPHLALGLWLVWVLGPLEFG